METEKSKMYLKVKLTMILLILHLLVGFLAIQLASNSLYEDCERLPGIDKDIVVIDENNIPIVIEQHEPTGFGWFFLFIILGLTIISFFFCHVHISSRY